MKTKQQIVEILKEVSYKAVNDDGYEVFSLSGRYFHEAASRILEQPEPEGDGLDHSLDEQYNKLLSEGKRLGVGQPSDSAGEEVYVETDVEFDNEGNLLTDNVFPLFVYKKGTIWLKKLTRTTVSEEEIDGNALVEKYRKSIKTNRQVHIHPEHGVIFYYNEVAQMFKAAINELNR